MQLLQDIKQSIQKLTQKKHVFLVKRGNDAIEQALGIAWQQGKKKLLICDQGGWLTYPELGKEIGFAVIILKTERGILSLPELHVHLDEDSVLLINSLPGYAAPQNMGIIENACKRKNALLLNDAAGSIGTNQAKLGDIIFASFGKDKPLKIKFGKAGFIAFENESFVSAIKTHSFTDEELQEINNALTHLEERLHFLQQRRIQVIKDLQAMQKGIVYPTKYGINVLVLFSDDKEKNEIITYCDTHHLEYTLCPREIRIMENAVSIEIKRL